MAVTPTDARVVPDCLMCHDQSGQYTKTYWDRFAAGRMGPDGKSMHENNWVRSDGKKRHTDLARRWIACLATPKVGDWPLAAAPHGP